MKSDAHGRNEQGALVRCRSSIVVLGIVCSDRQAALVDVKVLEEGLVVFEAQRGGSHGALAPESKTREIGLVLVLLLCSNLVPLLIRCRKGGGRGGGDWYVMLEGVGDGEAGRERLER